MARPEPGLTPAGGRLEASEAPAFWGWLGAVGSQQLGLAGWRK